MASVHRRLGRAGHRCERFWDRRLPCPFAIDRNAGTGKDEERKDEPPFAGEPELLKAMEVALAGNVAKGETAKEQEKQQVTKAIGKRAQEVDESSQGVVESDATRAGGLTLPQELESMFKGQGEVALRNGLQVKPIESVLKTQPVESTGAGLNLAQAAETQLALELSQLVEKQMRSVTSAVGVEPANEEEALAGQTIGSNPAVITALAAAAAIATVVHAAQSKGRGRGLKDVSRPSNVSSLDRGRGTVRGTQTGTMGRFGGVGGFFVDRSRLGVRPTQIRKQVAAGNLGFDSERELWTFGPRF